MFQLNLKNVSSECYKHLQLYIYNEWRSCMFKWMFSMDFRSLGMDRFESESDKFSTEFESTRLGISLGECLKFLGISEPWNCWLIYHKNILNLDHLHFHESFDK